MTPGLLYVATSGIAVGAVVLVLARDLARLRRRAQADARYAAMHRHPSARLLADGRR